MIECITCLNHSNKSESNEGVEYVKWVDCFGRENGKCGFSRKENELFVGCETDRIVHILLLCKAIRVFLRSSPVGSLQLQRIVLRK